jgi:hypothetical protein
VIGRTPVSRSTLDGPWTEGNQSQSFSISHHEGSSVGGANTSWNSFERSNIVATTDDGFFHGNGAGDTNGGVGHEGGGSKELAELHVEGLRVKIVVCSKEENGNVQIKSEGTSESVMSVLLMRREREKKQYLAPITHLLYTARSRVEQFTTDTPFGYS